MHMFRYLAGMETKVLFSFDSSNHFTQQSSRKRHSHRNGIVIALLFAVLLPFRWHCKTNLMRTNRKIYSCVIETPSVLLYPKAHTKAAD